ncbi:MAG: VTT domain-containing protein [bacterium]
MPPFIGFILSYILLYKYIALFIFVFMAGLIVPIPVNIVLVAIGAFSNQQYFDFKESLIIATLANYFGDICAYTFFLRFGKDILREKYAKKYSFFMSLEKYFIEHRHLSIFGSRIIGLFGTPVNFLSGYMKVSFWEFTLFDILGNFIFVLSFLTLGYVVGDEWINISGFINTIMGIVTVIILLCTIYLVYRRAHKHRVDTH